MWESAPWDAKSQIPRRGLHRTWPRFLHRNVFKPKVNVELFNGGGHDTLLDGKTEQMLLTVLLLFFIAQISSTPKPEDVGIPLLGTVEGVVVDPNGKPVEGAVVHETSDDDRPLGGAIFRTATTTDVDGKLDRKSVV